MGLAVLWVAFRLPASAQYVGPEKGEKVIFLGDCVMAFSMQEPSGYPNLVASALAQQGKNIVVNVQADAFHSSEVALKELSSAPPAKNTDWVIVGFGANENKAIWNPPGPLTDLSVYQKNMTSIVDLLKASGSKVVLLTTTMLGENPQDGRNLKLAPYNDFLRSLAKEKQVPLADLNALMQKTLIEMKAQYPAIKGGLLTQDNLPWNGSIVNQVIMNPVGNEMMAAGVLGTFGYTDTQIADAKKLWQSQPAMAQVSANSAITVRQYHQLEDITAAQGQSTQAIKPTLAAGLDKEIKDRLSAPTKP